MTFDFDCTYQNYSKLIYHIGILFFKDSASAEDLVQDCFLKLFEKECEFKDEKHLKCWLITVARNLCKNIVKRNRRLIPLTEALAAPKNTNHVLTEVFKLKPKERIAVYLFYYEDYSSKEIAKLLKTTDASVRSRLKRARAELKEMIDYDFN